MAGLLIEAEIQEVVVLDNILLGFETLLAGTFSLRFSTRGNEIGKVDHFRANETFLNVGMDSASGFPDGDPFPNGPGTIFLSADCKKANVTGIGESTDEESVWILQIFRGGDRGGFVGVEIVRRNGLKVFGGETRGEEEFFAFEQGFDLFKGGFFGGLWITAQARFDELEIFENQVGFAVLRSYNRVRIEQLILPNDIHLGISLFIRFDKFVILVETRIFEVVFAEFYFGNTEQSNFHSKFLPAEGADGTEKKAFSPEFIVGF